MFLSIIIPVFNAESYIKDCLQSLVKLPSFLGVKDNQIEVVLVDDGSKDNSGRICDELADCKYSFDVKVIHQQNQGVSVARNEGLKLATGEWVWFMDADDYLEILQERHFPVLENDEIFIVTGFIWEENGTSRTFGAFNDEVPYNLWRCWFKRDLIQKNDVLFVPGRKYAEDQEFILRYLISIGTVNSQPIPNLVYHYTMRPGSAMTRKGIKGKQVKDLLSVLFALMFLGMKKAVCGKMWYWKEMKRMTKTLFVVLSR